MNTQYCQSDGATIRELYIHHGRWLVSWIAQKTDSLATAEDLAQDTFCRLLRRPNLNRLQQPKSYLSSIANGLVIDHYRRVSLEKAYLDSLSNQSEATTPSLEKQALVLEALAKIDQLLDKMPAKMRTIFLLSRLDGLTYKQIAERLKISSSSVQKHMHTAIKLCYLEQYDLTYDS